MPHMSLISLLGVVTALLSSGFRSSRHEIPLATSGAKLTTDGNSCCRHFGGIASRAEHGQNTSAAPQASLLSVMPGSSAYALVEHDMGLSSRQANAIIE